MCKINKTWKKNRKKQGIQNPSRRFCSRALAAALVAALTVTAPFDGMQAVAFGAQKEAASEMPTGGVIEPVTESVVRVISDGTPASNTLRSVRPEVSQYDWDCYSNDYYYSKLSEKEQQLYERLDAACGKLLTSATEEASLYEVTLDTPAADGSATITRRGIEMVSTLGLTTGQVKMVQTLFIYANPQYYFLNTILLENTEEHTCALGVYDAFTKGADRALVTTEVQAKLTALQARVLDNGYVYETEAQIHDLLCDELTYLPGDDVLSDYSDPLYTQSIYGALMSNTTVCAGYTKLYALLCNYFGIDCISVTSTSHAWNQVRYGDHWYLVDVTWDDARDRSRYFHVTDQRMKAIDQQNSHVPYSFYNEIRPLADTDFDGGLMLMQGMAQPGVTVKDTAPGVTITLASDEGDIYYTLDGTNPTENDRYTEPIALTDSGTYLVTAVVKGAGKIDSAYEIFPVRIAGGSVSVSSAANVSGKKIKVKVKSTKTFTGYEVSFASKKDFSNQKSLKIKTKAATISGLKKGRTYYIRVRGYKTDAYGNIYYTPYSKAKKVTVKK